MDIKIIAMDLDGTLTNEMKEITPDTLQALMKVQSEGVRLVLASGRPPYGMRPLSRQLKMEEYGGMILCYNGGHVETCEDNPQLLVEYALDESLIPQLKAFQEESGMTLMTYYKDRIYTEQPDNKYVGISANNNKMKVCGVEDIIRDTPRPLNKFLMVGDPELVPYWEKKMQEAMVGKMHILRSTPYFIELLPIGIDKGPSLVQILTRLGLHPSQMMSFGDSYNDITMLQVAGIGVAMGNADDKVKASADYVTDTNENDGIAKALKHFGLI